MIERVSGILVSADDAAYLAGALDHLCKVLRDNGQQPRPRLESLHTKLTVAARTVSANGGCADRNGENPEDLGHVIGTGDACRVIGCTPSGVRDLARRGKIRARFTGTRWFYSAADVERYAEARAEGMER